MPSLPRPLVGLAGCGTWGRFILRDLIALGCDVFVIARSSATREFALAHGAVGVAPQLDQLPPSMAAAVVATPTSTHAGVISELLGRDVPIFCEKPLTTDAEAAARLASLGAGRLFVMDKWRYHPGVERLRDIARSGELGPVLGLRTTRVQPGRVHHDVDPVWILAPHDLSIALEILGYVPTPRHAVAELHDESMVGLLGILGGDPWMVLEVSASHAEYRREVRLICRDGTAQLAGGYADTLRILRADGAGGQRLEDVHISNEMPLLRELRAFVAHVTGGAPPRTSVAEAAEAVAALAALRALASAPAVHSGSRRR